MDFTESRKDMFKQDVDLFESLTDTLKEHTTAETPPKNYNITLNVNICTMIYQRTSWVCLYVRSMGGYTYYSYETGNKWVVKALFVYSVWLIAVS